MVVSGGDRKGLRETGETRETNGGIRLTVGDSMRLRETTNIFIHIIKTTSIYYNTIDSRSTEKLQE